ncbi:MAG: hypothetical protein LBS85_02915, partial [Clostridiales Family XIII bacterium]|nr:hypothetical protein [Clostridiales Family XIII bacterium]
MKSIEIAGVGNVHYILNPSGAENGAGEWDHVHGAVPGLSGTQDFRVNLYGNTPFAYYVEAYPSLPIEDSQEDGKYIAEAAAGGVPQTLYGTASMTHVQFWQSEGLFSSIGDEQGRILTDSSSPNKDNEGYYDLGGFDTVTRSTLTYGLGHTAFAFDNIIYGVEKTPPYAALNPPLTPNFVPVSFAGTSYTTADG